MFPSSCHTLTVNLCVNCLYCLVQAIQKRFTEFQLGIEAGSERYNRVEQFANALVEAQNPHSTQILERQEGVREAWDELLFAVDARREKLNAAAEIHR